MYINQVVCTHVKQAPKHRLAMPERTPFKLDRNDSTKTHAVPRCLELFVNRQDIGVSHSRTINAILALIRPGEGRTKTPEISHRYQKMAIFEVGDTFSKAHHFGALQPSVFRGVFSLMAC